MTTRATSSDATESGQRDYVGIALAYANAAIADKKRGKFNRWIRLAAKRFLADLKRAALKKNRPFVFDEWHACDACDFIEKLPHVEGEWETDEIVLHPSHIFFVVQLFGFRKHNGHRRFTTALFAVARKNAKSTLAAAILLYCQCVENEAGAQIVTAATTYDQAAIIFKIAKRMAEKTADLREAFGLTVWSKSIARAATGSSFKAIHSKASTQDGLNPSHIGIDEVHGHKTPELVNVLRSAAGARKNPLWLFTTTEGFPNAGPWSDLRNMCFNVLKGVLKNDLDHFLCVYYGLDVEDKQAGIVADDEFDESKWPKANPLLDVNPILLDEIRKEAAEAKAMPSKMAEFRIKRLNKPAAGAAAWVRLDRWVRCSGKVDLERMLDPSLGSVLCYAGLDLAATMDMCSFQLVWRIDGHYYTWGKRWVPSEAVAHRSERGSNLYQQWVETGLIDQTEGPTVDYEVIQKEVIELCNRFNPKFVAYDPWNARDLVGRLVKEGLPMIEFIQGGKSYHPAMQEVERAYMRGRLSHDDDPVLRWQIANVVVRRDANLNMSPDKLKSPDKIDVACSLFMGVGVLIADNDEASFWMTDAA